MNLASIDDVVARIHALVAERPGQTVWIGIDGFGGSGKTTLAGRLAGEIAGARLISVDDFAGPGVPTWEVERFERQVVRPLVRGVAARYERRGWGARATEGVRIPAGVPVVVEGVSCTDSRLDLAWDVTVWVHTDTAERRRRIHLRDDAETLARWESDWWPSEQAYAVAQHPIERADFVVPGDGPPA